MGNTGNVVVALALVVGCASDPPSCQVAVTHFYGVGCAFVNLTTGQPYTVNESIQSCKDINVVVPDRCQSFFDDYVTCLNEVPNSTRCTDCTDEQDALFGCQ